MSYKDEQFKLIIRRIYNMPALIEGLLLNGYKECKGTPGVYYKELEGRHGISCNIAAIQTCTAYESTTSGLAVKVTYFQASRVMRPAGYDGELCDCRAKLCDYADLYSKIAIELNTLDNLIRLFGE